MSDNQAPKCPICNAVMVIDKSTSYIYRCDVSHYSTLNWGEYVKMSIPLVVPTANYIALRRRGLWAARNMANDLLISELAQYVGSIDAPYLIEIGSGFGWFISKASQTYRCIGIEPDLKLYGSPLGQTVQGYFPACLQALARADLVVFNDSIEHIPDIVSVLVNVRKLLRRDGIISITLPVTDGLGYKLARLCAKVGIGYPMGRLWQLSTNSPHLHYLSREGLSNLLEIHGFQVLKMRAVPSYTSKNLYYRIGSVVTPFAYKIIMYVALLFMSMFLKQVPSDTIVVFARMRM